MKKDELLEVLVKGIDGIESKHDAEAMLKVVDDVIEVVSKSLDEDKKVTIGKYLTLENKKIKARSGVSKLGGVEKPWSTPEHYEFKVRETKSAKQLNK